MEKKAKHVLAAMLWIPSKDGDRYDDSKIAEEVIEKAVQEFQFNEHSVTNADYIVHASISDDREICRNKTLGIYDAEIETMNAASTDGVRFNVELPEAILLYDIKYV